jgi:hypothetical protein
MKTSTRDQIAYILGLCAVGCLLLGGWGIFSAAILPEPYSSIALALFFFLVVLAAKISPGKGLKPPR